MDAKKLFGSHPVIHNLWQFLKYFKGKIERNLTLEGGCCKMLSAIDPYKCCSQTMSWSMQVIRDGKHMHFICISTNHSSYMSIHFSKVVLIRSIKAFVLFYTNCLFVFQSALPKQLFYFKSSDKSVTCDCIDQPA